jgi:hypothetical protein
VFHPVVKVIYDQSPESNKLVLMGVEMEMDLRGADLKEFGVAELRTISDGGAGLLFAPYDGPHYNVLGNRAIWITLDGEGGPLAIPIGVSDAGWQRITPVLKKKKKAERGGASGSVAGGGPVPGPYRPPAGVPLALPSAESRSRQMGTYRNISMHNSGRRSSDRGRRGRRGRHGNRLLRP